MELPVLLSHATANGADLESKCLSLAAPEPISPPMGRTWIPSALHWRSRSAGAELNGIRSLAAWLRFPVLLILDLFQVKQRFGERGQRSAWRVHRRHPCGTQSYLRAHLFNGRRKARTRTLWLALVRSDGTAAPTFCPWDAADPNSAPNARQGVWC